MIEQLADERRKPQREAFLEFGPFKDKESLRRFFLFVTDFTNVDVLSNPFFDIFPPVKRKEGETYKSVTDPDSLREAGASFTCNGIFKRFIAIGGAMDFCVVDYEFPKKVSLQSTQVRASILSLGSSGIRANWKFEESAPEPHAKFSLEIYGFSGLLPSENEVREGMKIVGSKIAGEFRKREKIFTEACA